MPSIYRIIKSAWQLIPENCTDYLRDKRPIRFAISAVNRLTIRTASHQEVYDERYYNFVDKTALANAPVMARTLAGRFRVRRVLDVGCGGGALLLELSKCGIEVSGLEYSDDGLRRCAERNLAVSKFDLENKDQVAVPGARYDMVTSFEVAEHIPEGLADRFLDVLIGSSDLVVMSAATPGQGGLDHVNEQPHEYWINKFKTRGYSYDKSETDSLRLEWRNSSIDPWYSANVMVFKKSAA
ncbi:MAG: class I SAM-dependent methyltransferase [Verrucomicrobia bacterium]|nr:class I SAM-dependent methyltransferase [Verrucomicrobiota bacterium]